MILHNSKRTSWQLVLASAAVFGLTQFCQPGQAAAQVLNDQVNQLLANNCASLGIGTGGSTAGLGQNLEALCGVNGIPATAGALSTGGGAASVQGSAASILNRGLLQRLEQIDEEEGQAHA